MGRRSTRNGVVETATPAAIQQVFDWFNANGGANLPLTGDAEHSRCDAADSRLADVAERAWSTRRGVSRNWGSRAAVRADVIYRNYRDFYACADRHDDRRR